MNDKDNAVCVFMLEDVLLDLDSMYRQFTQDTKGSVYQFLKYGEPIEFSVETLKAMFSRGYDIAVLTYAEEEYLPEIEKWIAKHVNKRVANNLYKIYKTSNASHFTKIMMMTEIQRRMLKDVMFLVDSIDIDVPELDRLGINVFVLNKTTWSQS